MIVSPQRTQRPWQGRTGAPPEPAPRYDPECYLCPGNERANGARNPHYVSTYTFRNDFAALLPDGPTPPGAGRDGVTDDGRGTGLDTPQAVGGLLRSDRAAGECRVLCFSPRHDLSLAAMAAAELGAVVDLWREQLDELLGRYEWVQLFETRGAISGASNAHPHGQVWASSFLPDEPARELACQARHRSAHGTSMLLDYLDHELAIGERVVAANDHWVVVVPYWAYWPYETLVLPRRAVSSLLELNLDECDALTVVLQQMLRAFDGLFGVPFPYCSGWHSAPRGEAPGWQLHAHYHPPLLRSAEVPKIPASYEQLAGLQRDLTPELAAAHLRGV